MGVVKTDMEIMLDRLERRAVENAKLQRRLGRSQYWRHRAEAEREALKLARGPLTDGPTKVLAAEGGLVQTGRDKDVLIGSLTRKVEELKRERSLSVDTQDRILASKHYIDGLKRRVEELKSQLAQRAVDEGSVEGALQHSRARLATDGVDWKQRACDYALRLSQLRERLSTAEAAQRASKTALEKERAGRTEAERMAQERGAVISQALEMLGGEGPLLEQIRDHMNAAEENAREYGRKHSEALKARSQPAPTKADGARLADGIPAFGYRRDETNALWYTASNAMDAEDQARDLGAVAFATMMQKQGYARPTRLFKAFDGARCGGWRTHIGEARKSLELREQVEDGETE